MSTDDIKTLEQRATEETASAIAEGELYLDLNNMSADPESMASTMMGLYMPKYLKGVDLLSANALRRVLKKLVSYPLNDKEYKATSELESNVFAVGERLTEAKFSLMTAHYMKIVENDLKKETK